MPYAPNQIKNQMLDLSAQHLQIGKRCQAVADLLDTEDAAGRPMPIEAIAKTLIALDLCIIHKTALAAALEFIQDETENQKGQASSELTLLKQKIASSLVGVAS